MPKILIVSKFWQVIKERNIQSNVLITIYFYNSMPRYNQHAKTGTQGAHVCFTNSQ